LGAVLLVLAGGPNVGPGFQDAEADAGGAAEVLGAVEALPELPTDGLGEMPRASSMAATTVS